ncbi:MAG: bacitracin ABC transporter permease, partial [Lachnospiraceae bacterium]|nr:bacitracin ABC transporter permease [Lachnospiraceae bacterium]
GFQYAGICLAAEYFDFVTFRVGNILVQMVIIISAVLLGLFPLYVGMMKKSTIATVVSSVAIAAIVSNSQGSSAGLLSIPAAAMIFGITGIIFSAAAMKKMMLSDLSN